MKALLTGILLVIAVWLGYWLALPFLRDEVIQEPAVANATVISEGEIVGVNNKHARGTAQLVKGPGDIFYVRFEENFIVDNAPDLALYMGDQKTYDADAYVGLLKGNIGSQNIIIPSRIIVDDYQHIFIVSRVLRQMYATAELP